MFTSQIETARRTQVQPSAIRAIFDQLPAINQTRQQQDLPGLINLSIGQPHIAINPLIRPGLTAFFAQASADTSFDYSPALGRPETAAAIAKLYNDYYPSAHYTNQEVMMTNGASQALSHVFSMFLDKDDVVVTFAPFFSTYKSKIEELEAKLVTVPIKNNQFRPDADALRDVLKTETKAKILLLNYPNNPSGIALTKDELLAIIKVVNEFKHIVIVLDDVYRELNFTEHLTLLDLDPSLKERTIAINSGSKGLVGAPDMRLGMLGAKKEWIKKLAPLQVNSCSGVPYLSQLALTIAINGKLSADPVYRLWAQQIKQIYQDNVMFVSEKLADMGIKTVAAQGGFFVLADFNSLLGLTIPKHLDVTTKTNKTITLDLHQQLGIDKFGVDLDIVNFFLQVAGVAFVPGSGFGISAEAGFIRISCAKDQATLMDALTRVQAAVKAIIALKHEDIKVSHLSLFTEATQGDKPVFVKSRQLGFAGFSTK